MFEEISDREVALHLMEARPEFSEQLLRWYAERYPEGAAAVRLADGDDTFTAGVLVALLERTKAARPVFSEQEVTDVLKALNGLSFGNVPLVALPGLVASELCEGMIQEPEADPLRREIEDGGDPEVMLGLLDLPPGKLWSKAEAWTENAALSVIVSAHFWWAHRDILDRRSNYVSMEEDFRTGYFFRLGS